MVPARVSRNCFGVIFNVFFLCIELGKKKQLHDNRRNAVFGISTQPTVPQIRMGMLLLTEKNHVFERFTHSYRPMCVAFARVTKWCNAENFY